MSSRFLLVSHDYYGYASSIRDTLIDAGCRVDFLDLRSIPYLSTSQILSYILRLKYSSNLSCHLLFVGGSLELFDTICSSLHRYFSGISLYLYDNLSRYNQDKIAALFSFLTNFFTYSKEDTTHSLLKNSCLNVYYLPLFSLSSSSLPLPEKPSICFFGAVHSPNYSARRYWLRSVSDIAYKLSIPFRIYSAGSYSKPVKLIRDFLYLPTISNRLAKYSYSPRHIPDILKNHTIVINIPADDQLSGFPMRVFEVLAHSRYLLSYDPDHSLATLKHPMCFSFSNLNDLKSLIPTLIQSQTNSHNFDSNTLLLSHRVNFLLSVT